MADGVAKVNAFIGPSHVSVITGADIYLPIVERYQVPVVVSGFEPVDVMEALLMMVRQKVEGRYALEVQYSRAVTASGNKAAQRLVERFFETREHFRWRGLGISTPPPCACAMRLPSAMRSATSLSIRPPSMTTRRASAPISCAAWPSPTSARSLAGLHPTQPMGSCMVSSEGACNAYYRYMGIQ